jgi:hypothetical protein
MPSNARKNANDAEHDRGCPKPCGHALSAVQRARNDAIGARVSRPTDANAPKDNEVELPRAQRAAPRLLIQRLEVIARLMDELDRHLDEMDHWIIAEAMQRITGAGVINLIAKADSLSSALKRFTASLRNNELRRTLPKEALDD